MSGEAERTTEPEALTALILEVFKVNGALIAAGDALVGDLGLSSARWQVMGAIAMAAYPRPIAHIARDMGLSRQAVRRVVRGPVMWVVCKRNRKSNAASIGDPEKAGASRCAVAQERSRTHGLTAELRVLGGEAPC